MADQQATITVLRYIPEQREEPYSQTYQVPTWEGMMVLDALNYIRDELDSTLAFRWSCRMGICGSCGMNVNGRPMLTCQDLIRDYAGKAIRVEPLSNFPVIRDLVVDISDFFAEKLPAVKPWLVRRDEQAASQAEYRQTAEEREAYAPHSACINCMLCYAACPIYGLEHEFIGPAAIALAHRYNLDSRDQGADARRAVLLEPEAVWSCTFVGECSVACPKGVMPAEAIQQSKLRNAVYWAQRLVMPWSRR